MFVTFVVFWGNEPMDLLRCLVGPLILLAPSLLAVRLRWVPHWGLLKTTCDMSRSTEHEVDLTVLEI